MFKKFVAKDNQVGKECLCYENIDKGKFPHRIDN